LKGIIRTGPSKAVTDDERPAPGQRRSRVKGPIASSLHIARGLLAAAVGLALTATAGGSDAPSLLTGPTLRLHDSRGRAGDNAVADFMYFVPLISLAPVSVATEPGVEHRLRLVSITRRVKLESFVVTAHFEFVGQGRQQNTFDWTNAALRHAAKLKGGGKLERSLAAINVQGSGKGIIEVEGKTTNGVQTVDEVRLRFNAHGHASPVSIDLHDIDYREGEFHALNEIVARVNTLTFQRKPGRPKMEVTVASVKPKDAKDNLWQSLKGGIKGMAVNLLIPPLDVNSLGHAAMLDFGAALASQMTSFTFPLATNVVAVGGRAPSVLRQ